MADVDFSHAVLDAVNGETPLTHSSYLDLMHNFWYGSTEISVPVISLITNTPTKVSILYTGTFNQSGTEFYFAYVGGAGTFKVTNISFSAGDTYSFIIDIEIEGNT